MQNTLQIVDESVLRSWNLCLLAKLDSLCEEIHKIAIDDHRWHRPVAIGVMTNGVLLAGLRSKDLGNNDLYIYKLKYIPQTEKYGLKGDYLSIPMLVRKQHVFGGTYMEPLTLSELNRFAKAYNRKQAAAGTDNIIGAYIFLR